MRDGPDDSRSGLTEVCLGQLAPFIDDYKTALGVYALQLTQLTQLASQAEWQTCSSWTDSEQKATKSLGSTHASLRESTSEI